MSRTEISPDTPLILARRTPAETSNIDDVSWDMLNSPMSMNQTTTSISSLSLSDNSPYNSPHTTPNTPIRYLETSPARTVIHYLEQKSIITMPEVDINQLMIYDMGPRSAVNIFKQFIIENHNQGLRDSTRTDFMRTQHISRYHYKYGLPETVAIPARYILTCSLTHNYAHMNYIINRHQICPYTETSTVGLSYGMLVRGANAIERTKLDQPNINTSVLDFYNLIGMVPQIDFSKLTPPECDAVITQLGWSHRQDDTGNVTSINMQLFKFYLTFRVDLSGLRQHIRAYADYTTAYAAKHGHDHVYLMKQIQRYDSQQLDNARPTSDELLTNAINNHWIYDHPELAAFLDHFDLPVYKAELVTAPTKSRVLDLHSMYIYAGETVQPLKRSQDERVYGSPVRARALHPDRTRNTTPPRYPTSPNTRSYSVRY